MKESIQIPEKTKKRDLKEVSVQSMISLKTADVSACIDQVQALIDAGCRIIRISTPTKKDVECFEQIVQAFKKVNDAVYFIADVHYNLNVAIQAAKVADKVRINPGNFLSKNELLLSKLERKKVLFNKLAPLVEQCKMHATSLRIGVNHGSIYKGNLPINTSEELMESMIEYLDVLSELNFHDLVLSIKSSDPWTMIEANILLKKHLNALNLNYPIHLGVTEAGSEFEGRVKSALGIGLCLLHDVGNTVRVSLTEHPVNEIPIARAIIKSAETFDDGLKELILSLVESEKSKKATLFERAILIHEAPASMLNEPLESWRGDLFVNAEEQSLLHRENIASEPYELSSFVPFEEKERLKEAQYVLVRPEELQKCIGYLEHHKLDLPILVKVRFGQANSSIIHSAMLYPKLLRNGTIHGLYVKSESTKEFNFQGALAAEIFQVSGIRNVKSSIVSCPGCSRSNIHLENLTEEVRSRLHSKKIKVSIMGCAVNGYGEMIKSDLGLIGTGNGKVDIYKEKQLVRSAVKESLVGEFIEEYVKLNP